MTSCQGDTKNVMTACQTDIEHGSEVKTQAYQQEEDSVYLLY